MDIGNKIRDLRKERGLLQLEVADRISIARNSLSQIEKSRIRPSYEVLVKLALEFDVSTDYLLGIEDEFGVKIIDNEKNREFREFSELSRKIGIEVLSLDVNDLRFLLGYIARIKDEKK